MAGKENRVRIIAGRWRGCKLAFPSVDGLRPTTDPIRETLFNWLQPYLPYANCLDLFAGSGALGFEAASRGAKSVRMIERDQQVVKSLQENKALLKADNVQLMQADALAFLKGKAMGEQAGFDVVFLDPPFQHNSLSECTKRLEESGCLSDDAIIYLECERKLTLDFLPDNWVEHRCKMTGQVAYYLYQRK